MVEELGFEVVSLERGGGKRRRLVRVRIDRPDSTPGRSSVTVEDCALVARSLRELLGSLGAGQDLTLEVSSPGVERPLTKPRDFERFAGQRVRVRGFATLAGRAKVLEGELLGLGEDESEVFVLDLGGDRVEIRFDALASARLVYAWDAGR